MFSPSSAFVRYVRRTNYNEFDVSGTLVTVDMMNTSQDDQLYNNTPGVQLTHSESVSNGPGHDVVKFWHIAPPYNHETTTWVTVNDHVIPLTHRTIKNDQQQLITHTTFAYLATRVIGQVPRSPVVSVLTLLVVIILCTYTADIGIILSTILLVDGVCSVLWLVFQKIRARPTQTWNVWFVSIVNVIVGTIVLWMLYNTTKTVHNRTQDKEDLDDDVVVARIPATIIIDVQSLVG